GASAAPAAGHRRRARTCEWRPMCNGIAAMPEEGSPPERVRTIALAILRYLLEHPDAKDTADGGLRWWLPRDGGSPTIEDTVAALSLLAGRGLVATSSIGRGSVIYGAQADRLHEAKALLREWTE